VTRRDWQALVDELRGAEYQFGVITRDSPTYRVDFDSGLSDAEVERAENQFGFLLPPDLREFLQTALPRGPRFPDWRAGDAAELRDWLDRPRQGLRFDVAHSNVWLDEWGPRPVSTDEALNMVDTLVASAPRLIPIHAHRMMPDEPHLPGNPVLSVHQTDIIVYGADLADYLRCEFLTRRALSPSGQTRTVRFWSGFCA
jgi:hypothetical protein